MHPAKGAELTRKSIPVAELPESLIADELALEAFTIDKSKDDLNNPYKVAAFANAARARLLFMYQDWYDTLQIGDLFQAPVSTAKKDPLYEQVKQMVIETRNPSVAHAQRQFKLGYGHANSLIEAMEGEIVTVKDASGWRSMLVGQTNGRD